VISVSKARIILGRDAQGLSDEQIEEMLRECEVLKDMFWDLQTTKTHQVIDKHYQNTNIKLRS
jgi:hypothetical protein